VGDYEDPGGLGIIDPLVPTVIPQEDVRDYREDELQLRSTYALQPDLAVFVPNFSIYARYEHSDVTSTDRFSDFTENEVRIGMRIRR